MSGVTRSGVLRRGLNIGRKLLPGSQRHDSTAGILAQSGRSGNDARIRHRNRDGSWLAGRVGGFGAICSLRNAFGPLLLPLNG
jgi:hypothetical protein